MECILETEEQLCTHIAGGRHHEFEGVGAVGCSEVLIRPGLAFIGPLHASSGLQSQLVSGSDGISQYDLISIQNVGGLIIHSQEN